jgi:hypothetical protein
VGEVDPAPPSHVRVKSPFLVSGVKQKIFMQESDASNFLKRRGKRSPKSRDEVNGKAAGWSPSHCGRPKPQEIKVLGAVVRYLGPVRWLKG